jgi:hypothetical protein
MTENYRKLFETFMELEDLGVNLAIENSKLTAHPASRLTADLIDRIRDQRDTLFSIVARSEGLGRCSCGDSLNAIPTCDGFENFECCRCGECSGCRKQEL